MSNHSNEFCEACDKFHRIGKHDLSKKDLGIITQDAFLSIMKRAGRGKAIEYLAKSNFMKEGEGNGSGSDTKKNI